MQPAGSCYVCGTLRQHQWLLVDCGAVTPRVGTTPRSCSGCITSSWRCRRARRRPPLKFYGAILGLTQVAKPPELAPRGGLWFRDGRLEVHLGVEEPFTPARKAHPAFLVRNLDTLRERIETAGYRVTDDVALEGFHRCHVRDPFGNRLELVEPVAQ